MEVSAYTPSCAFVSELPDEFEHQTLFQEISLVPSVSDPMLQFADSSQSSLEATYTTSAVEQELSGWPCEAPSSVSKPNLHCVKGGKSLDFKQPKRTWKARKPPKTFTCEYCKKTFTCKFNLTRHASSSVCERKTARHLLPQNEFHCRVCGKAFGKLAHLKRHLLHHAKEEDRVQQCIICGKRFAQKEHLERHMKTHQTSGSQLLESRAECTTCGKQFAERSSLTRHEKMHRQENMFKCTLCAEVSPTISAYVAHQDWHMGERPYHCDECEKCFKQKCDLQSHIASVHTKQPQFQCRGCGERFVQRTQLDRHIPRAHGPVPTQFQCDSGGCETTFDCGQTFVMHLKGVHRIVSPKICKYCGLWFANEALCRAHVARRHFVKLWQCQECLEVQPEDEKCCCE